MVVIQHYQYSQKQSIGENVSFKHSWFQNQHQRPKRQEIMMMMTKKLALNPPVLTVQKWTQLQAHLVSKTDKKG
ncbi:hypothetical protein DPMN_038869 [Dreissena polymorpha]|uniref:Uncharacterized protein n=1 Tax=Dreissena polymorpha TaxID=45954 RepID=A0A9D4MDY7_DREPO|nr:hypothetical protein DPMN_038869 [Dreissena polymorpha]